MASNPVSWTTYGTTTDDTIQVAVKFTLYENSPGSGNYQVQVQLFNCKPSDVDPVANQTYTISDGVPATLTGLSGGGVSIDPSSTLSLKGLAVQFDGNLISAELITKMKGPVGTYGEQENDQLSAPFTMTVMEDGVEKWGLSFGAKWNPNYNGSKGYQYNAEWTMNGVSGTIGIDPTYTSMIDWASGDLSASGTVSKQTNSYWYSGHFTRADHAQFWFDLAMFSAYEPGS